MGYTVQTCTSTVKTPWTLRFKEHHRRRGGKTVRARELGLQTDQGKCTHEISAVRLPKQDLHNDHTN